MDSYVFFCVWSVCDKQTKERKGKERKEVWVQCRHIVVFVKPKPAKLVWVKFCLFVKCECYVCVCVCEWVCRTKTSKLAPGQAVFCVWNNGFERLGKESEVKKRQSCQSTPKRKGKQNNQTSFNYFSKVCSARRVCVKPKPAKASYGSSFLCVWNVCYTKTDKSELGQERGTGDSFSRDHKLHTKATRARVYPQSSARAV